MKAPFTPLFGRVLLRRERLKKQGSIIIPEESRRRHSKAKGEVLAVGENCSDTVKGLVGKTVFIGAHAGAWLDANGIETDAEDDAEFFICAEDDLLGVEA